MPLTPEEIRRRIQERCEPSIEDKILRQAVWVAVNNYVNNGIPVQQAIHRAFNWSRPRSKGSVKQQDIAKYFNQTLRQKADSSGESEEKRALRPKKDTSQPKAARPPVAEQDLVSPEAASSLFASLAKSLD